MVIGLIIGLRITTDQQRPEQTGVRRCETIRTGETTTRAKKCRMFVETAPTLAGLQVPFVCSETHELGEELVASYLYQVHLHH